MEECKNKVLFFFDQDGKVVNYIEYVGFYCKISNDELIVYGIDSTKIGKFNIKGLSYNTDFTNHASDIKTIKDFEQIELDRLHESLKELKAQKAAQKAALQNEMDFLETRHKRLLELIEYNEKELEKTEYFTKQWEMQQRKIITLENQLRTVDTKREKIFFKLNGGIKP